MTGSEGGANGHTAKKSPPAQAPAQDLTGAMALIEPPHASSFQIFPHFDLKYGCSHWDGLGCAEGHPVYYQELYFPLFYAKYVCVGLCNGFT